MMTRFGIMESGVLLMRNAPSPSLVQGEAFR